MKKKILSILSVATIITLAVLPVSAHFVEADFNHHAHVYEGSPITPKKLHGSMSGIILLHNCKTRMEMLCRLQADNMVILKLMLILNIMV